MFPVITLSQPNYSYGCFVVGVVLLLGCDNMSRFGMEKLGLGTELTEVTIKSIAKNQKLELSLN